MNKELNLALTQGVLRFLNKQENSELLALVAELYGEITILLDQPQLSEDDRAVVMSAYEMICEEVVEEMDFWVWIGSSNRTSVGEEDLPQIIIPAVEQAAFMQKVLE